ncbi:hypothetical protein HGM15179_015100 [Zosterops borbonicus]|uniref:Reverse transcriptase domain-containing protein n=1 Tax=Zosterops borbonicus TaxID=364589 RepID=A0A8K1LFP6_9PASS|nr:hypothetical protein HGM15179_015100 [Zosterops borbonicus]
MTGGCPIKTFIHKKDLENYRPLSLTPGPRNIMKQIILRAVAWQMTHMLDEEKSVDVVYQDSKAFDTVSHRILLKKLAAHGLDRSHLEYCVQLWDPQVFQDDVQFCKLNLNPVAVHVHAVHMVALINYRPREVKR